MCFERGCANSSFRYHLDQSQCYPRIVVAILKKEEAEVAVGFKIFGIVERGSRAEFWTSLLTPVAQPGCSSLLKTIKPSLCNYVRVNMGVAVILMFVGVGVVRLARNGTTNVGTRALQCWRWWRR